MDLKRRKKNFVFFSYDCHCFSIQKKLYTHNEAPAQGWGEREKETSKLNRSLGGFEFILYNKNFFLFDFYDGCLHYRSSFHFLSFFLFRCSFVQSTVNVGCLALLFLLAFFHSLSSATTIYRSESGMSVYSLSMKLFPLKQKKKRKQNFFLNSMELSQRNPHWNERRKYFCFVLFIFVRN